MYLGSYWSYWCVPGVHALHQDLVLLALHHVVGEHGVEIRDGGGEDDPVSAELMLPDLQTRAGSEPEPTDSSSI